MLCGRVPRGVRRRARPRRHGRRRAWRSSSPVSTRVIGSRSPRRSPTACACGSRRGTTRRGAAIRSRTACGLPRPAAPSAPASGSATSATCRPGTPTWSLPPSPRISVSPASLRSRRCSRRSSGAAVVDRAARVDGLRVLPGDHPGALLLGAGAADGRGLSRRRAADRRRHAVPQLRRLGDDRQLHGARTARGAFAPTAQPAADFWPLSALRSGGSAARSGRPRSLLVVAAVRVAGASRRRDRHQAAPRNPGRRFPALSIQPARPRRGTADSARIDRRSARGCRSPATTGDVSSRASAAYDRLGISLASACPDPTSAAIRSAAARSTCSVT